MALITLICLLFPISPVFAADGELKGTGYDPAKDRFYSKPTFHVTWIMIWNGSTETQWWKPTDYNGCMVLVNGKWQAINWNDRQHIKEYFAAIKAAGMNVIAIDFTNGFRWEWQAKYVQQLCRENGMKFVIAFNPNAGKDMESGCKTVWGTYAAPDADDSTAYLYKDGKPLVVLYTWREGYTASIAQTNEFRQKFSTVWASGEDSEQDKWGWQIEPAVGPMASSNSMFITGSVKFDSPKTPEERWRRNLSWLDYGFIMAKKCRPKFLIVGSFDDVHERNAWIVADTKDAKSGWQMRDISGALSTGAYYKRVCDWVLRGKPETIAGGLIKDGAYRVIAADGRVLGVTENRDAKSPAVPKRNGDNIENLVWFYHLGNNLYRMIKLNAGMPFEAEGASVYINWDSDAASQRWTALKNGDKFMFINKATGEALECSGDKITAKAKDVAAASQQWLLVEKAVLPR